VHPGLPQASESHQSGTDMPPPRSLPSRFPRQRQHPRPAIGVPPHHSGHRPSTRIHSPHRQAVGDLLLWQSGLPAGRWDFTLDPGLVAGGGLPSCDREWWSLATMGPRDEGRLSLARSHGHWPRRPHLHPEAVTPSYRGSGWGDTSDLQGDGGCCLREGLDCPGV
jgi:hypothetical protein